MKIVFNGRAFDSVDQMPPEARRQYFQLINLAGDANRNGVPDVLEQARTSSVIVKESITFNGREYRDQSELPAEARAVLERPHSPHLGPPEARIDVENNVRPLEADFTLRGETGWSRKAFGGKADFPWPLVGTLTAVILVLLWLWLSGIRPTDLFR